MSYIELIVLPAPDIIRCIRQRYRLLLTHKYFASLCCKGIYCLRLGAPERSAGGGIKKMASRYALGQALQFFVQSGQCSSSFAFPLQATRRLISTSAFRLWPDVLVPPMGESIKEGSIAAVLKQVSRAWLLLLDVTDGESSSSWNS